MFRTSLVCVCILVAAATVGYTSACTCEPATVESLFCSAQFASLFFVKDNGTVIGGPFGYRRYRVDLIYQYRTVIGLMAEPGFLYTPVERSACGVFLKAGYYYVISGSYADSVHPRLKRMTTNLCQLQIEFNYNPLYTYDRPECDDYEYVRYP